MSASSLAVAAVLALGAPAFAQGQSHYDVYGTEGEAQAQTRGEPGVAQTAHGVIVTPRSEEAAVVRVEAFARGILHVSTSPDGDLVRDESLMVVEPESRPEVRIRDRRRTVRIETDGVGADISKETGQVTFYDGDGKSSWRRSGASSRRACCRARRSTRSSRPGSRTKGTASSGSASIRTGR